MASGNPSGMRHEQRKTEQLDPCRWHALAVVLAATFMGMLDVFIVNVAAPSIQHGLKASFAELQLVIAGYVLAYAVGLVTGGRVGDAIGRKRAFLLGTAAFTAASLACALAPTAPVLIVFRILQGLAAALMLPQVLSIVQVSFPERERARALGFYGATIGLASIAGQLVGGLLIDADIAGLAWRAVFLVNLPIGILAIAGALKTVSESREPDRQCLDLAGVALLSLALITLMLPLIEKRAYWLIIACPILLAAFVAVEWRLTARGAAPLVPLRLFEQRPFSAGLATVLVFYSGNAALFLVLAYYLQGGLHLSPLGSGLTFLPLGVGFASTSLTVRRALPRFGALVLTVGALVMAAGLGLIAATVAAGPGVAAQPYLIAPGLFIAGAGQGIVAAPLINTVLERVSGSEAGAGSGVLLTATQIANALGVSALGAIFAAALGTNPATGATAPTARYETAFRTSLLVMIALALATAASSMVIARRAGTRPAARPTRRRQERTTA
jgi:EmrB/QacA subfamily drug resistance transporter